MNLALDPPRHLLKPCSGEMEQVFASDALEAVLAAARRPPSNEDSLAHGALLGGLRRSFVTDLVIGLLNCAIDCSIGHQSPDHQIIQSPDSIGRRGSLHHSLHDPAYSF